jgi:hypothetical protein
MALLAGAGHSFAGLWSRRDRERLIAAGFDPACINPDTADADFWSRLPPTSLERVLGPKPADVARARAQQIADNITAGMRLPDLREFSPIRTASSDSDDGEALEAIRKSLDISAADLQQKGVLKQVESLTAQASCDLANSSASKAAKKEPGFAERAKSSKLEMNLSANVTVVASACGLGGRDDPFDWSFLRQDVYFPQGSNILGFQPNASFYKPDASLPMLMSKLMSKCSLPW